MKLTTPAEYHAALTRVDHLCGIDPPGDSPEGRELRELVEVVEAYERVHFPFRQPSAAELQEFREAEACGHLAERYETRPKAGEP